MSLCFSSSSLHVDRAHLPHHLHLFPLLLLIVLIATICISRPHQLQPLSHGHDRQQHFLHLFFLFTALPSSSSIISSHLSSSFAISIIYTIFSFLHSEQHLFSPVSSSRRPQQQHRPFSRRSAPAPSFIFVLSYYLCCLSSMVVAATLLV